MIDDETFNLLVERVTTARESQLRTLLDTELASVRQSITDLSEATQTLTAAIDERFKRLEKSDEEKRRIWEQDAPKLRVSLSTRPRAPELEKPDEGDETVTDGESVAANVLDNIPNWTPRHRK